MRIYKNSQKHNEIAYPIKLLSILALFAVIVSLLSTFLPNSDTSKAAAPSVTTINPKLVPKTGGMFVNLEGSNFEFTDTQSIETSSGGDVQIKKILTNQYHHNPDNQSRTDVYIIGEFSGSMTVGTQTITSNGGKDVFIRRIKDPNINLGGSKAGISFLTGFGGAGDDFVADMDFDIDGNLLVTGSVDGSADFGTFNLQGTNRTSYLLQIDLLKPTIKWVRTVLGGDNEMNSVDFRFDRVNMIGGGTTSYETFTVGTFENSITLDNGATLTSNGGKDIYHIEYDRFGQITNAFSFGGPGDDIATDINWDDNANIYIAGSFQNSINLGTTTLTGNSNQNGFVASFDDNNAELWAVKAVSTGSGSAVAQSIHTENGQTTVAYNTNSTTSFTGQTNFNHTPTTPAGAVLKYNNGVFVSGVTIDGPGSDTITRLEGGSILGTFENTLSVDTPFYTNLGQLSAPETITSSGGKDAFVVSYDINNPNELSNLASFGGAGDQEGAGLAFSQGIAYTALNYFGNTNIDGIPITTTGNDYALIKGDASPNSATLGGIEVNFSYITPEKGKIFIAPSFPNNGWQDLEITNTDSSSTTIYDAVYIYNNGSLARQTFVTGKNDSGQLAQGSLSITDDSYTPIKLAGLTSPLLSENIKAGLNHTLLLTESGDVLAWGDNTYGQLGTGDNNDRSSPTLISLPTDAVNIWAVGDSSYIRLNNGNYVSFGRNHQGQLGNGTLTDSNTPISMVIPTLQSSETIFELAGGPNFAGYITTFGRVATWGNNDYGQLGRGITGITDPNPTYINLGSTQMRRIAAGDGHFITVDSSPSANLWSWGKNNKGQLGNGTTTNNPTPTIQSSITNLNHLAAANDFSIASNTARDIFVWGDNTSGQLGNGTVGGFVTSPQQVPIQFDLKFDTVFDLNYISAGGYDNQSSHIVVVDVTNSAWIWGDNTHGQLGNGALNMKLSPTRVKDLSFEVNTAKAGGQHTVFTSSNINPIPNTLPDSANVNEDSATGVNIDVLANDSDQECFNGGTFTPPIINYVEKIFGFGSIKTHAQTCNPCVGLCGTTELSGQLIPLSLSNSTVTIATQPTGGTITNINPTNGVVTYVPNPNFSGQDTFGYTVQDDQLRTSDVTLVTINVNPFQDAPTIQSFDIVTPEGVDYQFTISDFEDNFDDIDNDPIDRIRIDTVPTPSQGGLFLNNILVTNGQEIVRNDIENLVYRPAAGYNGNDTFVWNGSDGIAYALTPANVNIYVNGVPDAMDDTAATPVDNSIFIDVLDNDTDLENDPLVVCVSNGFTQGTNGTVVLDVSGQIRYTPNTGYSGSDTFTYDACDTFGGRDTATVTIIVGNSNNAPNAVNDTANVDENGAVTVDVLDNDTDPDLGDTLTICNPNGFTQPTNGVVTQVGQNLVYTPTANYTGPDSFTYSACDGDGAEDTATVNVDVNNLNNDPNADDDDVDVDVNNPITIPVLYNDFDPDQGDTLTICTPNGFTQPNIGTVIQSGNNLIYTPDQDFIGNDSFTYRACDNNGADDSATVNVSVNPLVNQAPTIQNQTIVIRKGSANSFLGYFATDPENNNPVTFTTSPIEDKLNCTESDPGNIGNIISCSPDLDLAIGNYTFSVTPRDSLGLDGNVGTFTVELLNPDNLKLEIFKDKPDNSVRVNDKVTVQVDINNPNSFAVKDVITTINLDATKITINPGSAKAGFINGQRFSGLDGVFSLSTNAMTDSFEYIGNSQIKITTTEMGANQTRQFIFEVISNESGTGDITGSSIISSIPGFPPATDDTKIPISTVVTSVLPRTGGKATTLIWIATISVLIMTVLTYKSHKKS